MKWWESLPETLRWILYVPSVLLVAFLGAGVFRVLQSLHFSDYGFGKLVLDCLTTTVLVVLIIGLGSSLAPRGKRVAVYSWSAVGTLAMLIGLAATAFNLAHGLTEFGWEVSTVVAQSAIGFAVTIGFGKSLLTGKK